MKKWALLLVILGTSCSVESEEAPEGILVMGEKGQPPPSDWEDPGAYYGPCGGLGSNTNAFQANAVLCDPNYMDEGDPPPDDQNQDPGQGLVFPIVSIEIHAK